MTSALTLRLIGTRNGKIRTTTIFQTAESNRQVESMLNALHFPEDTISDLKSEDLGVEFPLDVVLKANIKTPLFINGTEVIESLYMDFFDAKEEAGRFIENFDDVKIIAEIE